MTDFQTIRRAVIIGASGGIGRAFVDALSALHHVQTIYALSRSGQAFTSDKVQSGHVDILNEDSLEAAAASIRDEGGAELVLVTTGILSDENGLSPEKSYRNQSGPAFETVFGVNTFGPALAAKHFLPLLPRKDRGIFAALSARVGSISDNRTGGWHAYRASKAALNMLIRNYAIELSTNRKEAIIVSLHPGTVDTGLSKPFQRNVPDKQLFTPAQSASYLLEVLKGLSPTDTGKAFDWAGKEIPA